MKKRTIFLILILLSLPIIWGLNIGTIEFTILGGTITITIDSPQNITYNFNLSNNYSLDLNITYIGDPDTWYYSLYDVRHSSFDFEDFIFTPNTTINATRWENILTVYANNSNGLIFSSEIEFFINVSNHAPVMDSINSTIYTCERQYLNYYFNTSDVDEDTLESSLTPQFPSNPFYINQDKTHNLTLKEFKIYSGFLTKNDAGGVGGISKNYSVTISIADDETLDEDFSNITVIEVNNAPVITTIGDKTVVLGGTSSNFKYEVLVNDSESGNETSNNLTFLLTIAQDQSLFTISQQGVIDTTFDSSNIGVFNVTICVKDQGLLNSHPNITDFCSQNGSAITICEQFDLTISETPPAGPAPSGGGGAGGGAQAATKAICIEEYGCERWSICNNLIESFNNELIDQELYSVIVNECNFKGWDTSICGFQTRQCSDLNNCSGLEIERIREVELDIERPQLKEFPEELPQAEKIGPLECIPSFVCGEWSECTADYSMTNLVDKNILFKGTKFRDCVDLNECVYNIRSKKDCVLKKEITTQISTICPDKEVLIYDTDKELISRLELIENENIFNVRLSSDYCSHCYDKIKNFNENEIDCNFQEDGNCPFCEKIKVSKKNYFSIVFLPAIINAIIIVSIFLIILLIIEYYILQKKLNKWSPKNKKVLTTFSLIFIAMFLIFILTNPSSFTGNTSYSSQDYGFANPTNIRECYYTQEPSCNDGIKNCHDNSCELLVDCGGPCNSCPTCSDRIQNQGEKGIDCGGPCNSCIELELPSQKINLTQRIFSTISDSSTISKISSLSIVSIILIIIFFWWKRRKGERKRIIKGINQEHI